MGYEVLLLEDDQKGQPGEIDMTLNWLDLFPETVKRMPLNLSKELLDHVEEVRIREERPLEINSAGKHHFLTGAAGSLCGLMKRISRRVKIPIGCWI